MKNNRILVTGAQGQLGRCLQSCAKKTDFEIFGFDSKELDITKSEQIERYILEISPTLIINCAAFTGVDKAEDMPEIAYAVNEVGVENLAKAVQKNKCRLFHISTDYVFDGNSDQPYAENDPAVPLNVYGLSKLHGEQALARILPQALILRTSWIFSSYGNNFVKTMLRLGQEQENITVVDDQLGAPTWAGHIADALLKLAVIEDQTQTQGILHFTGWPYASWFDFARSIFERANRMGMCERMPNLKAINSDSLGQKARRPSYSCLNCSKLQVMLPVLNNRWSDGLTEVLRELKV